ncbi:MAG: hypothetical protein IJ318_01225 [Clostridia bacterium]|nr:hypothetical protein [Clostridia bacterium]
MNNLREYKYELYRACKSLKLRDVLNNYALPNDEEQHNMICGYAEERLMQDDLLYERAESIDYFNYEKELWRIDKPK